MGSLSSKSYCQLDNDDDGDGDDDNDDDDDGDGDGDYKYDVTMTMIMICHFRLKLVPDDRRCLQSPTLTGMTG